ncbi:MAG TPA: hypothetical protein PK843_16050 [bacterium]|nr:hypothetical protein [bacterium]
MNLDRKVFHLVFWGMVGFLASLLLFVYLWHTRQGILPSIIPILCTVIQLLVTEKVHAGQVYYPVRIGGYLLLNFLFFLLFLAVLFLLDSRFLAIKAGAFVIMSLVGVYSSFFLYQFNKRRSMQAPVESQAAADK